MLMGGYVGERVSCKEVSSQEVLRGTAQRVYCKDVLTGYIKGMSSYRGWIKRATRQRAVSSGNKAACEQFGSLIDGVIYESLVRL